MLYKNKIIDKILTADKVYIYGAGLMGKTLLKCLKEEPYCKRIEAFIVKDLNGNPDNIDEIPILDIEQAKTVSEEVVLVALHERHVKEALSDLEKAGFTSLIPISFDSDIWSDLRGNWMRRTHIGFCKEDYELKKECNNKLTIYVVHSNFDKKLVEEHINKSFEKSIQVGAALSTECIYEVCDNVGDNISNKNKEYCELTALYWMWKNDNSDYVGLSHYRRVFDLSEYEAEQLVNSGIDVAVTVPVVNLETVREQYAADHNIEDWDIMLEAIRELYPDYYNTADEIQKGYYYYGYNMFIARKDIFNNYCEWLFNILDYCEARIKSKNDNYQRRYAGFLAERLLTIYFAKNKQYKVVVVKKHFIESE